MSIIKFQEARTAGGVRALEDAPAKAAAATVDPCYLALQREVDRLTALLAEKDAEIERGVKALDEAFKKGRDEGCAAALEETAADREALAANLEAAVDRSLALLERELSSMERLAVVLAVEGLEKILGTPGAFADIATQIIREQLGRLDRAAIVRIEVSAADFIDADCADALASQIGAPAAEICLCEDLASGDCRIKMTLGALDIGVNQQWGQLKAVLQELSEPVVAP